VSSDVAGIPEKEAGDGVGGANGSGYDQRVESEVSIAKRAYECVPDCCRTRNSGPGRRAVDGMTATRFSGSSRRNAIINPLGTIAPKSRAGSVVKRSGVPGPMSFT
jgi:hypothetical protein